MRRIIFCLPFYFLPTLLLAQEDSLKVFSLADYYHQILLHHPVAKQASLLSNQAKQEIRMARGMMDPTITSKYSEKELGGEQYYALWDNVLRIPVWYGLDIRAGFERNVGAFVNEQNRTSNEGLTYLGITVPLGQGLIIDERRATIQQAKLLENLAEAEQVSMINKLLLEAAKVYWDWVFAYHQALLYEEGFKLAQFRFSGLKERVVQGDLPAIDSVEAKIEMQNRQVIWQQSTLAYQNASLQVSNFLWKRDNTPLELPVGIVPATIAVELQLLQQDSLNQLLTIALENHPDLLKLNIQQERLGIERRFLADKFKPKINVDLNLLQRDFAINNNALDQAYYANNYRVGFSFHYPLFLRQERGRYQLNKIKAETINWEQQQLQRNVLTQIRAEYNEILALRNQILQQEQIVINASILRNGEQQLFDNGESSLFLINTREMNLINHEVKLYNLRVKYGKAQANLGWAAGNMQ